VCLSSPRFLQVSRRENGARHHHSASLSSLQPQKTACSNSVSWRYRRERLKMEGSWDHTVSQNNLCPNNPRDGDPCLCVILIDHASRTPQFFQIDSTIIFSKPVAELLHTNRLFTLCRCVRWAGKDNRTLHQMGANNCSDMKVGQTPHRRSAARSPVGTRY